MHKRVNVVETCPDCGTQIGGYRTYNYLGNGKRKFNFCPECGRPCKEQEEDNEKQEKRC